MRKKNIIIYSTLFLFILNLLNIYSFEIKTYNKNNLETDFFSFESSIIKIVINEKNIKNCSVDYNYNNNSYNQIINLTECTNNNNLSCGEFNLLKIIKFENNIFYGPLKLNITSSNISKTIYIDIRKPIINYLYTLNKNNITLILKVNDSISGISKIYIFFNNELKNSIDLENQNYSVFNNSYTYTLEKERYNITIEAIDKANNINRLVIDNITIKDFIPPKIIMNELKISNNNLIINFSILDNSSIYNYEIIQNNYKIEENNLNKTKITKIITIPSKEPFYIISEDYENNKIIKNYSYINFNISLTNTLSNNNLIRIKSPSEYCFVSKENNKTINKKLKREKENIFIYLLDNKTTGNKVLKGYCKKDYILKNFELNFFLDTNSPSLTNISIEKTKNGFLKIKWKKSYDNESKVNYKLYRNNKLIYSGTKTEYLDDDVKYPNEYTYYLLITDSAGNSVKSNIIKEKPLDIFAELEIKNSQNFYLVKKKSVNISLLTEPNSTLTILTFVNETLFNKETFNINNKTFIYTYLPKVGTNKLTFILKDKNNNTKNKTAKIVLNPLLSYNNDKFNQSTSIKLKKSNITSSIYYNNKKQNNKKTDKPTSLNFIKFFLILFLIFIILAFLFLLNNLYKKYYYTKKKKEYIKKILKDKILEKRITKNTQTKKDIKKKDEKNKRKKKKEKILQTEYSILKLKEINKKRNLEIENIIKNKKEKKINKKNTKNIQKEEINNIKPNKEKKDIFGEDYFIKKTAKNHSFNNKKTEKKEIELNEKIKTEEKPTPKNKNKQKKDNLINEQLNEYLKKKGSSFKKMLLEKKLEDELNKEDNN